MRTELLRVVAQRFRNNPVVMLRGPRQCGKTTLARQFAEGRSSTWFDLEAPADAQRLAHPMTALERLRGTVVIDEAQLLPALFPVLRVLVDRRSSPAKFLVLGSASPELASGVSESLAGRVALVPMGGFDLSEMLAAAVRKGAGASLAHIWPARTPRVGSGGWISFKPFSNGICAASVCRSRRRLCADSGRWQLHYHGQILNASEIGRSLGDAHTTVRRHLDVLCGAFVMRQLLPWYESVGKRQVKSPKVFVRDSGLLHALVRLVRAGLRGRARRAGAT